MPGAIRPAIFIPVCIILILGFRPQVQAAPQGGKMELTSPAFKHNDFIPSSYTCDGQDINPPLGVKGIPSGAKSLALIVDDPDAPAKTWVHWVVCDISVVTEIKENSIPGTQGINDGQQIGYGGPCPPSGVHRYFIKIYALDTLLNLQAGVNKKTLEKAMQGHILDQAELIGLYKRR